MTFNGHFPKLMLSNDFSYGLLCSRIRQKQYCNKCVWSPKALCQTARFCNKFQEKLFLFQWFGPVFLSSSSPKVGICSKRCNLHISSFLRFAQVLFNHWQTMQQNYRTCNKKTPWPHTSNILDITFHWISAANFWLQNFNKKLIKERNVLQIFVKEHFFEKKCFDNKTWKEFSSVMDRPMFLNMSKTCCDLVRLGTSNLIDVFSKVFTE